MIFNTNYKLDKILPPLSQEEILNTPEFFAMSTEQIYYSPRCPRHLRTLLLSMPWTDRPNFVQVRPQDFRKQPAFALGQAWHVDVNTNLANGQVHLAKNLDEFRSMVVSFGDVAETEFVRDPLEIDTSRINPYDHGQFAGHVSSLSPAAIASAPNQVAVYTGRDIHRVGTNVRLGNARLIIVSVECDDEIPVAGGQIRPSIMELGR